MPSGPSPDRRAGVLLHISSLPGPYGIGDLGPEARKFLAWLEAGKQRIWQTLPVNPTDDTGSPYASPSAMARNPLLLSIDDLVDEGWLTHAERPFGAGSPYRVDHHAVRISKGRALNRAADRVRTGVDLAPWLDANPWAKDWSLFAALVEAHGGRWTRWPEALRHRDADALGAAADQHADAMARHAAKQWLFARQWGRLREDAERRGIALWGDVPYFVGGESCDVWAAPHLFRLDAQGAPVALSGVPPDAFAEEGQCWGTPHYDLEAHAKEDYRWWCERLARTLELFHEIRLDHFRGFAGVWEIPAGGKATEGRWIDSFGAPLLAKLREHLGGLPLIAEDLGIITDDVAALRDGFDLPGMVILQFAFEGAEAYMPHNHHANQVVYPGTHDNATSAGWYFDATPAQQDLVRRYLSTSATQPAGDFVRSAWRSVAKDAVVAMQDLLGLGNDCRMNTPGTIEGNWAWRAGPDATSMGVAGWLAAESKLTGRAG